MLKINRDGYDGFFLEIQVWNITRSYHGATKRYCIRGIDDSLWTNSIDEAINFMKTQLIRIEEDAEKVL